ncbi:MAG: radical SAM protein [Bacteroidia bacterium]|nr:radical SAM protein [Bacteroidia bacterium]
MLGLFHTLYLEATRRCNLSCQYCSSGSNIKHKNETELSYNDIMNRILKPGYELGTRYIEFSGGEFLLREDAFELLAEADRIGYRIGIASNGTTINEKNIYRLKDILGKNILISLGINSFNRENKNTRSVDFDFTLSIIKLLEQHNINMNICVTTGAFNADSFADTLYNINLLKLPHNRIPFVPRNADNRSFMFDKAILKEKLHPVLRKYYHGYVSFVPFFLSSGFYEKFSGQNEHTNIVPTNPSIGCWCGSFYAVNPSGEVSPCPLLSDHISGGNIINTDLFDILYKSEVFVNIVQRKKFEGRCGSCRYRFTCGGCRAMTYYYTGNLYGSDPTCFIDELSEEELAGIEKEICKNFKNYLRMAKFGGIYTKY